MQFEPWMWSPFITLTGGIAVFFLLKYRVDQLEANRKEDLKKAEVERGKISENLQRTTVELSSRLEGVDGRVRHHTGNIYEALDAVRGAGAVLESRVGAIETSFNPARIHEWNQRQGEQSEKLRRVAEDVRRLEDNLLDEIKFNARNRT